MRIFSKLFDRFKQSYAISYRLDFGKSIFQDFLNQIEDINNYDLYEIYFSTRHPTVKFYIIEEYTTRLKQNSDCTIDNYYEFIQNFLQTQVKYAVPKYLFENLLHFFPKLNETQQLQIIQALPTQTEKTKCIATLTEESYITLRILGGNIIPSV